MSEEDVIRGIGVLAETVPWCGIDVSIPVVSDTMAFALNLENATVEVIVRDEANDRRHNLIVHGEIASPEHAHRAATSAVNAIHAPFN